MSDSAENRSLKYPLFRARSLQFLFYFAGGAIVPFFSWYYYKVFTGPDGKPLLGVIGAIMSVQAIMGVLAPPLAGFIADKFKIHKKMLSICALLTGIGLIMLSLPGFKTGAVINPAMAVVMFTFTIIYGLAVKPLIPLIDTESLNDIRLVYGNTNKYGTVRLFGSLAWAFSAPAGGLLLYVLSPSNSAMLLSAAVFIILGLATVKGLNVKVQKVNIAWNSLLKDKRFFLFLFFILMCSLSIASSYAYTSIYLEEQNQNTAVTGLILGLSALIELPAFFIAPRLLKKMGDKWMMVIGAAIQALKLVSLGLMGPETPMIFFLLANLLHGAG